MKFFKKNNISELKRKQVESFLKKESQFFRSAEPSKEVFEKSFAKVHASIQNQNNESRSITSLFVTFFSMSKIRVAAVSFGVVVFAVFSVLSLSQKGSSEGDIAVSDVSLFASFDEANEVSSFDEQMEQDLQNIENALAFEQTAGSTDASLDAEILNVEQSLEIGTPNEIDGSGTDFDLSQILL